jgi:Double zinc ribbon
LVGVLLAAGATYFVLLPIVRPPPAGDEQARVADEGDDPDDDMSPQTVALRALKEIEFDRATGKLADADYEQLKAKYTAEALAAMRGEGARPAVRDERDLPQREMPVRAPLTAHRAHCPEHGARPESDAAFCGECGRRLGTAPGYCVRCGTALETDARYCNRCGARVAA